MPDPRVTELYRHFAADGRLLYVGVSYSTVFRLIQHKQLSSWFGDIASITIERFPSREAAFAAEKFAIETEQPAWNVPRKKPKKQTKRVHKFDGGSSTRWADFDWDAWAKKGEELCAQIPEEDWIAWRAEWEASQEAARKLEQEEKDDE